MHYRRAFTPGGSFFVTEGRRPILASRSAIDTLRTAFRSVIAARPFTVDAIVILPDYLHCVWTLPPDDVDFATRWRLIKTAFTKHCEPALRDETDFARHIEYIHYNPVKHRLAAAAIDWPHSSFRRYVEPGVYSADWGRAEPPNIEGAGHE